MSVNQKVKVILIPGNGGQEDDNLLDDHYWFSYLYKELPKLGLEVIIRNFPDPDLARANYWLPFLKNDLQADENTILIGHSSGAVAAMRFAEKYSILGSILIAGSYTDLGDAKEKASGYFDTNWDWESIKKHQQWIIQFHSLTDPWIPIEEARYIHKMLNTEYHEEPDQGHFGGDREKSEFPEIVTILNQKLKQP